MDSTIIFAALLGFILGSVPFGLLLTRAAGLGDVRDIGSGSIGATNVLRTGNKGLAAATVLLDAAKGAVPVLIAATFLAGHRGCRCGCSCGGALLYSLAEIQRRQGVCHSRRCFTGTGVAGIACLCRDMGRYAGCQPHLISIVNDDGCGGSSRSVGDGLSRKSLCH